MFDPCVCRAWNSAIKSTRSQVKKMWRTLYPELTLQEFSPNVSLSNIAKWCLTSGSHTCYWLNFCVRLPRGQNTNQTGVSGWLCQLQLMRDTETIINLVLLDEPQYKQTPLCFTAKIYQFIFVIIQCCHLYFILFPPCFLPQIGAEKTIGQLVSCHFLLIFYVKKHFFNFKNPNSKAWDCSFLFSHLSCHVAM